ncbi:MAG: acyltransferase [Romboutsia sp.]|nr:acyltransferase [Romboutsia sp.]
MTNWWPNNRITIKIRGILHKPFFKSCGNNLQLASGIVFINTHNITVGSNVYISYNVWLNGLAGLIIDDEVILGPNVVISTLSHNYYNNSFRFGGAIGASVHIGKGTWIASNATVKYGVSIGSGCLIGANSSVIKNVKNNTFVSGVPAKVISDKIEAKVNFTIIKSRSGFNIN